MANTKKTVSLVLGSGGARGLAHIGVIRWLEEHEYQIQSISGCSMGALVGGIYAAGKLDELEQWIRALTKLDILTFLDVTLKKGGFVKGDKIISTLKSLTGDRSIEDLSIPYTAVAADIVRGKEVWIDKGPLFDAIRASISLPFFFTPFQRHGVNLIDGGVLNPVPIAPTFKDLTDLTVAVNLGGSPDGTFEKQDPEEVDIAKPTHLQKKIRHFLSTLRPAKSAKEMDEWGVLYIATQSFDAMQGTIARQKLAVYPPDFVVEIPRNVCSTLEFYRADEMIALGYEKARKSLAGMDERRMQSGLTHVSTFDTLSEQQK